MRITPACAGKTLLCIYQNQYESDHPRVCGENAFFRTVAILQRGSPPRVRGKHIDRATKLLGERITPACAGKTCKVYALHGKSPDHPRVCGENFVLCSTAHVWRGSPPRVRGKRRIPYILRDHTRITPACAGKT